jgi:hypothetical protein
MLGGCGHSSRIVGIHPQAMWAPPDEIEGLDRVSSLEIREEVGVREKIGVAPLEPSLRLEIED